MIMLLQLYGKRQPSLVWPFSSYDYISKHISSRVSLSPVNIGSPLDKWDELNLNTERNGNRKWKLERRRSSKNSSNEFLWWVPRWPGNYNVIMVSQQHPVIRRQTQQSRWMLTWAEKEQHLKWKVFVWW